jgi:hypothetical protein
MAKRHLVGRDVVGLSDQNERREPKVQRFFPWGWVLLPVLARFPPSRWDAYFTEGLNGARDLNWGVKLAAPVGLM